jgi:hypothetical protein
MLAAYHHDSTGRSDKEFPALTVVSLKLRPDHQKHHDQLTSASGCVVSPATVAHQPPHDRIYWSAPEANG